MVKTEGINNNGQKPPLNQLKMLTILIAILGVSVITSFVVTMMDRIDGAGLVFFVSALLLSSLTPLVDMKTQHLRDSVRETINEIQEDTTRG